MQWGKLHTKPMMWFSLFIMFSMTLILFNELTFSYKPNKTKSQIKKHIN